MNFESELFKRLNDEDKIKALMYIASSKIIIDEELK